MPLSLRLCDSEMLVHAYITSRLDYSTELCCQGSDSHQTQEAHQVGFEHVGSICTERGLVVGEVSVHFPSTAKVPLSNAPNP